MPSLEFIWRVFISLVAIVAGIIALYWICGSALYMIVLAVDLEVSWARKNNRKARTDAVAKATIGFLVLIFLALVFYVRY